MSLLTITAWRALSFEGGRTGPVFSTMTSVIAPCLSALLLPLLLLLLLASSAYEQVRVVCALSGAAAVARRRRAAVAKAVKNAVVASVCGHRASSPSLVVSARRCCGSSINAVRVCGDTCERSLQTSAGGVARATPVLLLGVRLARSHRCVTLLRATVSATLTMHSQTFSSMRASPHHGCAMGVPCDPALNASVPHGRTAPPMIKCSRVPGHRSSTSGSSVTNTSCQYALRGQLIVLDIGAVATGRLRDRGPRRAVTTATLTHSGHCSAFCTFRIHRYGVAASARHVGGAV